jgi:hypothetical protein
MEMELDLTTEPQHDAKHLLSAGFRSIREQKRFAKLLTYAVIYQQGGEWDEGVITETRDYCEIQVRKLGFPDGWGGCGSYEELKRWFFQACL